MAYDTIIRNGRVFDGFGQSRMADIAIKDGIVADISSKIEDESDHIIDAKGLWVTPGFIDIHTHYDLEVEIAPGLSESVRHGVTSVVMGGCSLSATYGEPKELAYLFSRVETLPVELIEPWLKKAQHWHTADAYLSHIKQLPLGPNVASMLGHSALRIKVMGLERSLSATATTSEIEQMRQLAEEALDAGCIGISIDMVHWHKVAGPFAGRSVPSHYASYEEYAMLAKICRKRDAVFQVTPNPENPLSFLNILRMSPGLWRAPLRVTILSALDMDGAPQLWRLFPFLLFICNRILGCNIRFQALAEPFTIYSDGHLTPFFEEFAAGVKLNNCTTKEERQTLWADPAFRKEFKHSWNNGWARTFHRDLSRMTVIDCPNQSYCGKNFVTIAEEANKDPLEYFMHLLEIYDESLRWVACSANLRKEIRQKLMGYDHILPGFSDAGAHCRNLAFFDNALSVIRQAVSDKFLTPEKAIAKVTGEAAHWFNLDAGHLTPGKRADITLLDPQKLTQPIPPAIPTQDPAFGNAMRMIKRDQDPAVKQVLINGKTVIYDGEPLPSLGKEKHGRLLYQLAPTQSEKEALARHRNRIHDHSNTSAQTDYWHIFLQKHRHPANIACHCIAFVIMYAVPLFALALKNPWILALWPASQLIGIFSHALFEPNHIDQRDAVFSWRALISLHRMFFMVTTGRYGKALTSLREPHADNKTS